MPQKSILFFKLSLKHSKQKIKHNGRFKWMSESIELLWIFLRYSVIFFVQIILIKYETYSLFFLKYTIYVI